MRSEVTSWLRVAVLLVCVMTIGASAFDVGDIVKVITNTNVRAGPGTSYAEITDPDYSGTAGAVTLGKITSGPQTANGYTWWGIDFGPGSYSGWVVQDGLQATAPLQPPVSRVALTLYVYEGSVTGPLILGARVTGQDGGGSNFDQTTNTSGYVTIYGRPGTWTFTAAKDSYQPNLWSQSISSTCTRYAFLQKLPTAPQLPNSTTPVAPPLSSPQKPTSCAKSSELHGSQVNFAEWGWTNPLPSENMYVSSYGGFMDSQYPKDAGIHLGVDLLGSSNDPVNVGTPVFSICPGRVDDKLKTESYEDVYMSAVFIVDDSGVVFVYGHVRDPRKGALLRVGDRVAAGQQIGEIGPITYPGAWPKAHLHLGVNTQGHGYYHHPQKSGWGIAPSTATLEIISEKGWVDPVLYVCEHSTTPNVRVLDVPFITQSPPGTWDKTRNCGQASILMVLSYYDNTVPVADRIKEIDDWLSSKYGDEVRDYNGSFTDRHKLVTLAREYGGLGQSYTANQWNLQNIVASIDQGWPVVAAIAGMNIPIEYKKDTEWVSNTVDYEQGHWVVVTGYSAEYIICNDSGRRFGKNARYRRSVFLSAMNDNWSDGDWKGAVVVATPASIRESFSQMPSTGMSILGKWVYDNDSRLAEITTLQFEKGGTVLMVGPLGNVRIRASDCSSGEWEITRDNRINFSFIEQSGLKATGQIDDNEIRDVKIGSVGDATVLTRGPDAEIVETTSQGKIWSEYIWENFQYLKAVPRSTSWRLKIRPDKTFLSTGSVIWRWRIVDGSLVKIFGEDENGNAIEHSTFTIKDDKLVDKVCGASYRRITTTSGVQSERQTRN